MGVEDIVGSRGHIFSGLKEAGESGGGGSGGYSGVGRL